MPSDRTGVRDDDAERIVAQVSEAIYGFGNFNFTDRARPYNGQSHTVEGARGATMVQGLTFRDVCDCFRRGWLLAQGRGDLLDSPDCTENDIYDGPDVDPIAVMQNMSCEMEKLMGIFPNVPTPTATPTEPPDV
jgi:hypothetical protein